jgi:iron complex outermembrane receptor protein
VLNLHTAYTFWRTSGIFLSVNNVFDKRYATYGKYGDPTAVGAPGIPSNAHDPGVDNRFQTPGARRSVFDGVRIRF